MPRNKIINKRFTKIKLSFFVIFLILLCGMYINSTTFFRLKLAEHYIQTQNIDKAIIIYKKILRKETSNNVSRTLNSKLILKYYISLASLLIKENRIVELPVLFAQISMLDPQYKINLLPALFNSEDPITHYQVALIHYRQGRQNEALSEFYKFIHLSNNLNGRSSIVLQKYLCDAYYHLGLNLEDNQKQEMAAGYYRKIVDMNDNRIIGAYYRLKSLYKKKAKLEDAKTIELKLLNLKPEQELNYRFSDKLILLGYTFNDKEFELFNTGGITFFWELTGHKFEPYITKGKSDKIVYKIDNKLFIVQMVENLAPNFGFEMGPIGKRFPYGWRTDYYGANIENHEIAYIPLSPFKDKCLILNNSTARNINCQTDYIAISNSELYLQAGMVKGEGNACLGRVWFGYLNEFLMYDYVFSYIHSPEWKYYSQVVSPPINSAYCRLWIINYQADKRKAYFDNVLFVKIEAPCL